MHGPAYLSLEGSSMHRGVGDRTSAPGRFTVAGLCRNLTGFATTRRSTENVAASVAQARRAPQITASEAPIPTMPHLAPPARIPARWRRPSRWWRHVGSVEPGRGSSRSERWRSSHRPRPALPRHPGTPAVRGATRTWLGTDRGVVPARPDPDRRRLGRAASGPRTSGSRPTLQARPGRRVLCRVDQPAGRSSSAPTTTGHRRCPCSMRPARAAGRSRYRTTSSATRRSARTGDRSRRRGWIAGSRADLGVWSRPLDGGPAARIFRPIDPDARFGRTWRTELAWSEDGRTLIAPDVRRGRPAASGCSTRPQVSGGLSRTVARRLVGLVEQRLVVHGACRGLPVSAPVGRPGWRSDRDPAPRCRAAL